MNKIKFLLTLILSIAFSISAFAQFGMEQNMVHVKAYNSIDKVTPGSEFKIALKVNIDESWHINSDKPYDEFLIASDITVTGVDEIATIKIAYPIAHDITLSFSEDPLSTWQGEVFMGALLSVSKEIKPGTYKLVITLNYQACDNKTCLAPTSVEDTLTIEVGDKNTPVNQLNPEIFEKIDLSYSPAGGTDIQKEDDSLMSKLESSSLIISLLLVFLGGLALNLTPCVYPLIPITIGYFGGQSEGSTGRLFLMGLFFVLGMALTYSVIGVVTSFSGAMFGALLQNTFVILFIVLLFLILSLSMFGVYEFKLPDSLVAKAGGAKTGFYGAFFMGLTMGIVAAPCIGPFVLGLVTVVAAKGDPLYGFVMFFVLALGLGTPYLVLAMFSGKIKKLPRSGEWMDGVKHVFGFIMIGMAFYFLLPLLPKTIAGYVLPVFMIIFALYLMFFEKLAKNVIGFKIFRYLLSVILIAVAVYALIPSNSNSINWQQYDEQTLAQADKAVIIDFYADWCIPCKELDAETFSDAKVIEKSKNFIAFKADLTKSLSPEVEQLREKYKIIGVPTVLIIDSKGNEKQRITGFVNAEEFYRILDGVQ
ncbi:MAG: thioredoxin fold domain-containing protein [Ignavibacteriaceae bacterium]|nr:thioredoxin fold domain-containing protein [Ignavibacteriaceae bacterium]